MAQVIITINYREYPISCEDGEEIHIMKLGRLLDEKARSLTEALGPVNENQLLAMVGLLIADDLNELKKNMASAQPIPPQPAAVPAPTPVQEKPTIPENALAEMDTELAEQINSLSEIIKSVALKLKSV